MANGPPITMGDRVRVLATPETEAAGFARLEGVVDGQTIPGTSEEGRIIGPLLEDYAVNVFFPDRDEQVWFAEQLLVYAGDAPGGEVWLKGRTRGWRRRDDGNWDEIAVAPPPLAPEKEREGADPDAIWRLVGRVLPWFKP